MLKFVALKFEETEPVVKFRFVRLLFACTPQDVQRTHKRSTYDRSIIRNILCWLIVLQASYDW